MSDILAVIPLEVWGELKRLVRAEGSSLERSRIPVWGYGKGPRLLQFLHDHLSGKVYDENLDIVEGVVRVEYLARDPNGETKTVVQETED